MFVHVVAFKWNHELTSDELAAVTKALNGMPIEVPLVRSYHFGPDAKFAPSGNWDFGIVATFDSSDDWHSYDSHPHHNQVRTEILKPLIAERAAVQFEVH